MLRNGDDASNFELGSSKEKTLRLGDYKGKMVILLFFRGAWCPTTDKFLTDYQDFYSRIIDELKGELIGISTDSYQAHKELAERLRLEFPLLSDLTFEVSNAYGVYKQTKRDGTVFGEPALVIVDAKGKIAFSVISSGPKGLMSAPNLAPVMIYMESHKGTY